MGILEFTTRFQKRIQFTPSRLNTAAGSKGRQGRTLRGSSGALWPPLPHWVKGTCSPALIWARLPSSLPCASGGPREVRELHCSAPGCLSPGPRALLHLPSGREFKGVCSQLTPTQGSLLDAISGNIFLLFLGFFSVHSGFLVSMVAFFDAALGRIF